MPLILASASPIRRALLVQAGIEYEAIAATVDEAAIKKLHHDADTAALELAEAKALQVSADRPADWIIGSDSIVTVDGWMFDKPADRAEAEAHLRLFAGKVIILTSAVALARGGKVDWSLTDRANLTVRPLSDRFIADYLDAEWPAVSYCVGVFRMEGRGVALFDRIEGSHFTILGLPLLPLLGALRARGLVQS
ncbi:MAG: Maf family protein [Sphingomonas sp.]|nr:Maf family protein [Sphingomonas sp.]